MSDSTDPIRHAREVVLNLRDLSPSLMYRAVGAVVDYLATDAGATTGDLDLTDLALEELSQALEPPHSFHRAVVTGTANELRLVLTHSLPELGLDTPHMSLLNAAFPHVQVSGDAIELRRSFAQRPSPSGG